MFTIVCFGFEDLTAVTVDILVVTSVYCLDDSLTLKMDAVNFSDTYTDLHSRLS
jgi:hypothetical protein